MSTFRSPNEYNRFAHAVRQKARYLLNDRSKCFIDALLETTRTSPDRVYPFKKGSKLWRAQKHSSSDKQAPLSPERMVPLPERAFEGRCNSKGIPCLYLALNPDTAMSEVRPWIGSIVSVAKFEIVRDVKVVHCADDSEIIHRLPEREYSVWTCLNLAFSEPVDRSDDVADYAPTQILAEVFRDEGYDGIMYESRFGEVNVNVALFDINSAKFVSSSVYRVEELHYKFAAIPETGI